MSDWLCQDCKSVNSSGARNCYRCWTPRKFGEAPDPATLPPGVTVEQAHEERKQQLRPTPADAKSSRRRSWFVLALITATVAFNAMSLAFVGAKGGSLGIALSLISGDWTGLGSLMAISLVGGVLAFAAMIAWFVWFDRVLANVPPLTGTWPEVSRVMAVVWWLVPVIGQLKGTFVVGHVYGLMAVASSPGLWLLGLWGITWIGGTLAPSVAGFIVGWLPLPLEESVNLQDLISNLGQLSYITAGFFAAALILTLEHARDTRMAAQAAADDADTGLDVPLADRLAGRAMPSQAATSWSGAPPSWPTGPGPSHDPPAWPGAAAPWPAGPGAWPTDPGAPGAWPAPPQAWPGTSAEPSVVGGPSWPADPAFDPAPPVGMPMPSPAPEPAKARSRRRRRAAADRPPVPFEPILIMGALVLAGVVGGITMAGMADPLGSLGRLGGQLGNAPVATPWPTPAPSAASGATTSADPAATPQPSASAGAASPQATARPTPRPSSAATPRPVAADLVARRLVQTVTPASYRGVMDVAAVLGDDADATTWDVRVGRVGEREYRLVRVARPGVDPELLERAALVSTVWERVGRDDWVQRRKTDQDRATPPLFDVTRASDLESLGTVDEDGTTLYRFGWQADDARLQQFLGDVGVPTGLRLRSAEVLATADGVPVRLEAALAAGDDALRLTIGYSDVGSDIQVRNPRVGPPLVVRR